MHISIITVETGFYILFYRFQEKDLTYLVLFSYLESKDDLTKYYCLLCKLNGFGFQSKFVYLCLPFGSLSQANLLMFEHCWKVCKVTNCACRDKIYLEVHAYEFCGGLYMTKKDHNNRYIISEHSQMLITVIFYNDGLGWVYAKFQLHNRVLNKSLMLKVVQFLIKRSIF